MQPRLQPRLAIIRDRASLTLASARVVSEAGPAFRRKSIMIADLELLDRWCAGDAGAGNELLQRHFTSLYGFFQHKTAGEADDLVQETLLQCVKNRETFQRQSTF